MKNSLSKLAKYVLEFAVIFAVAASVPYVLAFVLHTPKPLATITSSSMWPALRRGDLVVVHNPGTAALHEGLIVVYDDPHGCGMVIHRIVGMKASMVVTKGDANVEADDPIPVSDIVGSVVTVLGHPLKVPYVGYVTFLVRQPPSPQ